MSSTYDASVCLQGVYENQEHVYIVMEQCTGGELFDAIVSNGRYAESHAAALIRTIVGIVSHCHNMNVIHRVRRRQGALPDPPRNLWCLHPLAS